MATLVTSDELTTLPSPAGLKRLAEQLSGMYPVTAERLNGLARDLVVLQYKINSLLSVVERLPGSFEGP